MPAVIIHWVKEGMVECAPYEMMRERIVSQHVEEGVRLGFEPELVLFVDIAIDTVGSCFTSGGDDLVVVWAGNGADSRAEAAREEVVPGSVAEVGEGGVADECCFERPFGLSYSGCGNAHRGLGRWTEPSYLRFVQDIC